MNQPFAIFGKEEKNDKNDCRARKSHDKYEQTKHNMGFMAVDLLAKDYGVNFSMEKPLWLKLLLLSLMVKKFF